MTAAAPSTAEFGRPGSRGRGPGFSTQGALALGFVILLAIGAGTGWLVLRSRAVNQLLVHTQEVRAQVYHVFSLAQDAEMGQRGYLLAGDDRYLGLFRDSRAALPSAIEKLVGLISDNPRQITAVAEMRPIVDRRMEILDRGIELRALGGDEKATATLAGGLGYSLMEQLRVVVARMIGEEDRLMGERGALERSYGNMLLGAMLAGIAIVLLLAAVTIARNRRSMADLVAAHTELGRFNERLEFSVQARTAELRDANEEIQRFAYIVSHDLRSPLVNVMGFTTELDAALKPLQLMTARVAEAAPQLLDPEAKAATEADIPEALGFIRSSTAKMDRLIGAILRLSREGKRVLTAERLKLDDLMASLIDGLRHQCEERGAKISVDGPLPEIVSDRVALEQIFGNLLDNAVKYLDDARPGRIVVRARRGPGMVTVEVADNGRGIEERDRERVFELFRRAGAQDRPGEGIGLAHVRALVRRLGGTIDFTSKPGGGSTFRVSLPATLQTD